MLIVLLFVIAAIALFIIMTFDDDRIDFEEITHNLTIEKDTLNQ